MILEMRIQYDISILILSVRAVIAGSTISTSCPAASGYRPELDRPTHWITLLLPAQRSYCTCGRLIGPAVTMTTPCPCPLPAPAAGRASTPSTPTGVHLPHHVNNKNKQIRMCAIGNG